MCELTWCVRGAFVPRERGGVDILWFQNGMKRDKKGKRVREREREREKARERKR